MVKAVALTAVHVCRKPGQKGPDGKVSEPAEVDEVPAGTVFELTKDQFEDLRDRDAVRLATKVDLARGDTGLFDPHAA